MSMHVVCGCSACSVYKMVQEPLSNPTRGTASVTDKWRGQVVRVRHVTELDEDPRDERWQCHRPSASSAWDFTSLADGGDMCSGTAVTFTRQRWHRVWHVRPIPCRLTRASPAHRFRSLN